MRTKMLACASLMAAGQAFAAPCPSGSYEIGPYLGVESSWHHLKLDNKHLKAKHSSPRPNVLLGARVTDTASIELSFAPKLYKSKLADVVNTVHNDDGSTVVTTIPGLTQRHGKINLRALWRLPMNEDASWLLGAGVSHVKLKLTEKGLPSLSKTKLVPQALAGAELGLNEFVALRLSGTYSPGLGHKVANVRARHHIGANIGLVFNFR